MINPETINSPSPEHLTPRRLRGLFFEVDERIDPLEQMFQFSDKDFSIVNGDLFHLTENTSPESSHPMSLGIAKMEAPGATKTYSTSLRASIGKGIYEWITVENTRGQSTIFNYYYVSRKSLAGVKETRDGQHKVREIRLLSESELAEAPHNLRKNLILSDVAGKADQLRKDRSERYDQLEEFILRPEVVREVWVKDEQANDHVKRSVKVLLDQASLEFKKHKQEYEGAVAKVGFQEELPVRFDRFLNFLQN